MKPILLFEQWINEESPEWHDSDAPDAEGRFKELSIKDLASWLIKTRNGDVKKISGSLTQQVVFNRNDDPEYADKMEKTRKEVYRQLGREDLLENSFFHVVNETVGTGGIEYEGKIHDALVAAKIDGLDPGEKPGAGFSNQGAGDLELKLNGKDFNVEVKMDTKAQMGGTSIKYDAKTKRFEAGDKDIEKDILVKLLGLAKSKAGDIEKYVAAVNLMHKKLGIDYVATGFPIKTAYEVKEKLKGSGHLKAINVVEKIDNNFIIKHYNDKGVFYINIGGQGLFYVGKNPLGLPIPAFNPEVQIELRLGYGGGKVFFNVNNNKIPARNGGYRAQARLVRFKDKSPYNLDDPKSIQAMFAKMKK